MNSSTLIYLELEFSIVHTMPDICVRIDNTVVLSGPQKHDQKITIDHSLNPGRHCLSVDFTNKNYKESSQDHDMAVIVKCVKFQHLDNDFAIYSCYRPEYPEPWLSQQSTKPNEVIHGNYLGWNGHWYLEFETPIYRWIHRRLNLGWLL